MSFQDFGGRSRMTTTTSRPTSTMSSSAAAATTTTSAVGTTGTASMGQGALNQISESLLQYQVSIIRAGGTLRQTGS